MFTIVYLLNREKGDNLILNTLVNGHQNVYAHVFGRKMYLLFVKE